MKKKEVNVKFLIIVGIVLIASLVVAIGFQGHSNQVSTIDEVDLNHEVSAVNQLIISEISSTKSGAIADSYGNCYDYIELYNGTNHDIYLDNYGLSDDEKEIKWVFPANTLIPAKEYLLVWCSGKKQEGLYTNYKLSSSGNEVITLRKPSGKVIDAVKTVPLEDSKVMARDANGKWVIQNLPTPNQPNTLDGYEAFLNSIQQINDQRLIINEFLPRNEGNFLVNGNRYGYIELKNVSDETLSLANYSLSDTRKESFKWQFPNITLKPNEIIVVYTSGENLKEGVLHTSFKLRSQTGDVVLTNNAGQIVSVCSYENLADGTAMVYRDGDYFETATISPGFENDADGALQFQKTQKITSDLIISEAMNGNSSYLPQNGAQYYDWIELKNVSDHEIQLSDYSLSDRASLPNQFILPNVVLKPNEYYVVMASGNPLLTNKNYVHANFKLSNREGIYLSKNNQIVDALYVFDLPLGYSVGKDDQGAVFYYSTPTPLKNNADGAVGVSSKPVVDQLSTAVNGIDELVVSMKALGTIYYTTDGSVPTTKSNIYQGPLHLKKSTVLNVRAKEDGKWVSDVLTYSYIINENHTLPVLSMSIAPTKLKDLHSHAWTEGYEVGGGSIELFEDGESKFFIPMGLQLFGGSARGEPKKCYEVVFKKKYGAGHLEYPLFSNRDSSYYQSFVLRTGSQDEEMSMIRDIVGTSLMDDYTEVDVQAYKPIILYINGKYWGIYFIREKVDEVFVANHYNIEANEANTDIVRIDGTYKSGNKKRYNALVNFVSTHDLSKKENYEKVKTMIDVENCIDYWIGVIWTTNNDIVNCRMFANPYLEDGRFHYIFYDLDFAFYNYVNNFFQFTTDPSGMTFNHYPTTILRNLMKNAEFRSLFVERLSYNLKNTWNQKIVLQRIDEITSMLEPEIKRDRKRWNYTYQQWIDAVDELKYYCKKRDAYIKKQAKSYFHLSDAEYKKYFG
ncbi:MAG: CotH kinase family protein [Erysipelotrichaceae bacterium]|nr:CotH kinase family protein [Erysipelotrichaceae bacterium]